MKLYFVSREKYRQRNERSFHAELRAMFGEVYILPEGGSNALALSPG